MIKILHTADIHLGAEFSSLGNKGASQREQLRITFKNIIATAIDERANIVLSNQSLKASASKGHW